MTTPARPTAFISYAHDDDAHVERVREFHHFLCGNGIDAESDLPGDETPRDWTVWMTDKIAAADYLLVVASPQYRIRADEKGDPASGRGVRWEAMYIRSVLYSDITAGRLKVLGVVLPGCSADGLPSWMPATCTRYDVTAFAPGGADPLLRYMLGKPLNLPPVPGPAPALPSRPRPV